MSKLKRVFTHKSKLFLILVGMILALSCESPLGDEGTGGGSDGGGGSGGGGTQVIDGKEFPAWYLTEQQQQQNFSMGPTILFQSTKTPTQHYRIPAIIVASNGNIVAISDNRYTHGGDIGAVKGLIDVVYKVSSDGGKTWSAEKIMGNRSTDHNYSKAENKGDALVFRANDGTLVCMAVSGGGFANGTEATPSRMVRSESKDNGETWSSWQEVGQNLINEIKNKHGKPKAFASAGRGLTLKDETFTAAMTAQNSGNSFIIIYTYSTDKGMTWNYGGSISDAGGHGTINEPKVIAELDDGKLLMSVRNASGSGGNATTITQTKNRMYAIFDPTGSGMPTQLSAWNFKCGNVDAEGVVWTRAGEQDITRIVHIQGGPNYRRGLRLYISTDQGQTFPNYYQITADSWADSDKTAYSSLDTCGDGTIVTLAEEKSKTGQYYDIVFRRYNMKTLTGEVYQTSWYK